MVAELICRIPQGNCVLGYSTCCNIVVLSSQLYAGDKRRLIVFTQMEVSDMSSE